MDDRTTDTTYKTVRGKRRHRPIRSRILRSTAVLPAGCTLLNGLSGFAAIHFAAKDGLGAALSDQAIDNLKLSAVMIFVAMIFDMLDGRLARMTRTTSDFGAQLDSLCDVISFGVAPALLVLRSTVSILRAQFDFVLGVERIVWCIAGLYVLCAVLRLARFNVETDADESAHMDFRGLPSPAAAACLASVVLLFTHLTEKEWVWLNPETMLHIMSFTLPILAGCAGLLMVTRFRYPHLINQYIRGKKPFSYLVRLVLILLAMILYPYITLAVGTSFYAFWGPIRSTWRAFRSRRSGEAVG